MSRTHEIDVLLQGFNESLALEQTNLASITQGIARNPGDLELRSKMRQKRGYIDQVTEEIADLTAARQVIIDQANSEEGLAATKERKEALANFIEHADNKFVAAGKFVDQAFLQLMAALHNLRLSREEIQEAWAQHFMKLDLDGDQMESIGFLSRMNLGDCSPYVTSAFGQILMDLIVMSGLNMQGIATVNLMGYTGYDLRKHQYPEGRTSMEWASHAVGRKTKSRAIEHEARYG